MSTTIHRLPRISPDEVGISSGAIVAFVNALEKTARGMHSFMLLRHGKVAAEGWWEPYAPSFPHVLFSLSKSFTSTALGFAVSEGLLTVDDPVVSFFPQIMPASASDNLKAMCVRHLLTMSTGHDVDPTGVVKAASDGDWVRAFLNQPVVHEPGSKFVYNSVATYMCSAIIQKLTEQTMLDYLTPRLFGPLGIANPVWDICPKGINVGGWGLSLTTEDIARFGQCYLQNGKWDGSQVVPAEWVREATAKQVSNGEGDDSDWTQGYGYQFWRCRHNAFRGDGAFGQYCVVMPEQDMVLAITAGIQNLQAPLTAVWDHILPGTDAGTEPNATGLSERLSSLAISAPIGHAHSQLARKVSGKTYRLEQSDEKHQSVTFAFSPDGATITFRGENGERIILSGHAGWADGRTEEPAGLVLSGAPPVGRTAARGAWTLDDTYTVKVCYVETPFIETLTCRFTGDDLVIERKMNVNFQNTARPTLTGHAI